MTRLSAQWRPRLHARLKLRTRPCPSVCPSVGSDLGDGAEAAGLLAGSHHQQVAPLVALVIQRPGEADLARLLPHVEKAAGVDQQAVADRQLLERDGRHHQEAAGAGVVERVGGGAKDISHQSVISSRAHF